MIRDAQKVGEEKITQEQMVILSAALYNKKNIYNK